MTEKYWYNAMEFDTVPVVLYFRENLKINFFFKNGFESVKDYLDTEILNLVSQIPDTFQYFAKAEPPNSKVIAYVTLFNLIAINCL